MNTTGLVTTTRIRSAAHTRQRHRVGMTLSATPMLGRIAGDAGLTLDVNGCITNCTPAAARLLGCDADSLAGQAIKTLIAKLPLASNTPGYNLAYAVFHSRDSGWMHCTVQSHNGQKIPVEVALGSTHLRRQRLITLNLRLAVGVN